MTNPHEIERSSFEIIRAELAEMGELAFSDDELTVLVRVIHATADFEFRHILRFHPEAISAGLKALHQGSPVVTDVHMTEVGISNDLLAKLGGRKICSIRSPEVRERAAALGQTRSTMAMRHNATHINGGIVAIGNAPTALLEVIRLVREEGIRPALIVGVPVGFVSAVESKDELLTLDVPYITTVGRKGGSPVAAATINALLRLATA